MNLEQAYQRLSHAGILHEKRGHWTTTPLWDRAFMRAQARVVEYHEAVEDLRLPISYALVDILGARVPDAELRDLVEVLLPIELRAEEEMEPEDEVSTPGGMATEEPILP